MTKNKMPYKCAIKDCTNTSDEGKFLGVLCAPCANTDYKAVRAANKKHASQALHFESLYLMARDEAEAADQELKIMANSHTEKEMELVRSREKVVVLTGVIQAVLDWIVKMNGDKKLVELARDALDKEVGEIK